MKVKNILIGDDIRQEVGNKISMMGIFGSSLTVQALPTIPEGGPIGIQLSFLITIENSDKASDPKDFDVKTSISLGEQKLLNISARIESQEDERIFHLPIPKVGINLQESIPLSIAVQILKEGALISEDTTVLDIILMRPQPPTAPKKGQ